MTRDEFERKVSTFEGAVDWAKTALTEIRSARPDIFQPGGFEETQSLHHGRWALSADCPEIAQQAATDYAAHRAMMLGCASFIRERKDLPDWANDWLANFLEEVVSAPAKPRGAPTLQGLHHLICNLIKNLVDCGWIATRNDVTDAPCACDVLAEALCSLDLKPKTYEGVKRIFVRWTNENGNNEQVLKRLARTKQ